MFTMASSGSLEQTLSRDRHRYSCSGIAALTKELHFTHKGSERMEETSGLCSRHVAASGGHEEGLQQFESMLSVGLGKCGMWEKVIYCEISGVNIPHGVHHPALSSAESHPLTSCDIRQGSFQVSILLQRLRRVSSFGQNVKSRTLQ